MATFCKFYLIDIRFRPNSVQQKSHKKCKTDSGAGTNLQQVSLKCIYTLCRCYKKFNKKNILRM